jgi:hypothetical protein
MKTTSLNPEIDSIQDMKTGEQLPDAPKELLFLMDHEEKLTDEESIDL